MPDVCYRFTANSSSYQISKRLIWDFARKLFCSGTIIRIQDVELVAAKTFRAALFCGTAVLTTCSFSQGPWRGTNTDQLVIQLDDPDSEARESAYEALKSVGIGAFDQLYALRNTTSLEQQLAVRRLLQHIEISWTDFDIPESIQRILADYQRQSIVRKKILLERIEFSGHPKAVFVLAKLARFEKSEHLSRQAALCLLRLCTTQTFPTSIALETIGDSPRMSCIWIRDAFRLQTSQEFVERWLSHLHREIFAKSEQAMTWQSDIMFQLAEWSLSALNKREQFAVSDEVSLLIAESCSLSLISDLTDLLIRLRHWKALDTLVERFAEEFNNQPLLIYRIAYAKLLQGQPESANHRMKRATQLGQSAPVQLETGVTLHQLGYPFIAEMVLDSVSRRSDCPLLTKVRANLMLAEWHHQEARNAEAAFRLESILQTLNATEAVPSIFNQIGCRYEEVATRRCLYEALDCFAADDFTACEANLLKGLQIEPGQVDLLILGHQCQYLDRESFDLVQELIQLRKQDLMDEIEHLKTQEVSQQSTTSKSTTVNLKLATLCNRYAWLTANTNGDTNKALRFAQLANQLDERNPYYLDTEAKCWFVLGDIDRALARQTEACRLARHNLPMQQQLESFKRFERMTPIARVPGTRAPR